ncbi:MAG TPA: FAD-binding protein [Catalimonadaceae bacterium]|nr:FAD-binding protein [Catalimonadaceae bacterium]
MKDLAIIGGGLAGLTAGLIANRMGHSVVLYEKKAYPFHKVCGEYLSLESEPILRWLGLPIDEWKLPFLTQFRITHPNGKEFKARLPLGGIGISRFTLDNFLQTKLIEEGGTVLDNTRVTSLSNLGNKHHIINDHTEFPEEEALFVFTAAGRNRPSFPELQEKGPTGKRYVGVKLHVLANIPVNQIELHHFPGGYCGISAIENGGFCLCYLIDEELIKTCRGNLEETESRFLHQNRVLKQYFTQFPKLTDRVSTAGVFFSERTVHADGMLLLGDSAGMIPPLAGNGMSMAIHSAVLATNLVHRHFTGSLVRNEIGIRYEADWKQAFSGRLRMARMLQSIMEKPGMTAFSLAAFQAFPGLFQFAVSQTHGSQIPVPEGNFNF